MAITLPDWLTGLMSELGLEFPKADEDEIAALGAAWTALGTDIAARRTEADATAAAVWDDSTGADIDAFKTWWQKEDSPPKSLEDGATGAGVTGTALQACALIVIGLKIYIIGELIATAFAIVAAIAAAIASGGLAGVAVIAVKQAAKEAIGLAIEQAVTAILEG
ncbi:hypothetical protein [Glycomyces harbinensis]|uniref:Outer membrane channel protein CpnT-like N-terminal domain-containing protein n=1 Tax=Glycomyces harbinensis TaxID=58114 RepID=A0A1G6V8H9_9ACTN|nr:hypothetical protein [Glycomyces harbinensis]SDD49989.1 hypothetical protein SAMN05216270_104282 [Glycomyces harbinensis]